MASTSIKIQIIPELAVEAYNTIMEKVKGLSNGDSKVKINVDTSGFEEASTKSNGFFSTIKEEASTLKDKLKGALNFSQIANFSIAGLATEAITGVVGKITDGFNFAMEKGQQFQQSMAGLSAITGVSGKALEAFGESAKQLSERFGGSANDQVGAFQGILSKIGPQLADTPAALNKVTESVNLLSKASGLGAKESMDSLVDSMLQFGVNTDNANEVARESASFMNVMAASAKEGSAEIPQVAAAINVAGGAAKLANLSFEETNAAIQTLAIGALKGSEAGSGLRNVLSLLQKQSGEGDKVLKGMGLSTLALGKAMQSDGLTGAIEKLKGGLEKISDPVKRNQALMQLFGAENTRAANLLLENSGKMKEWTGKITGTNEAVKQAETNMNTFGEASKRANAYFENLAIGAFEKFSPILGAIMGVALSTLQSVVGAIGQTFSVIGNVLSPIFNDISGMVSFVFGGIIDTIKKIFAGVDEAFKPLTDAWNKVSGSFANSQGVLTPITDALKYLIGTILEVAGEIGIFAVNTIGLLIQGFAYVLPSFEQIGIAFNYLKETVLNLMPSMDSVNFVLATIGSTLVTIAPYLAVLTASIIAYEVAINAAAIKTTILEGVQKAWAITTNAVTFAKTALTTAVGFFTAGNLRATIQNWALIASINAASISAKAGAIATNIFTVAQTAFNAVMSANPVAMVVLAVAGLVAGVIYAYKNFEPFTKMIDGLWASFIGMLKPVKEFASAIGGLFTSKDKKEVKVITTYENDTKELDKVAGIVKNLSVEEAKSKKKTIEDTLNEQLRANKITKDEHLKLLTDLNGIFKSKEEEKKDISSKADEKKKKEKIKSAFELAEIDIKTLKDQQKLDEEAFANKLKNEALNNEKRTKLNKNEEKAISDLKLANAEILFQKAKELTKVEIDSEGKIVKVGIKLKKDEKKTDVEKVIKDLQNDVDTSKNVQKTITVEIDQEKFKDTQELLKFQNETVKLKVEVEKSASETLIKTMETQINSINKSEILSESEKATQILAIEKNIQAEITRTKLSEIEIRQKEEITKAKEEIAKLPKGSFKIDNSAQIEQLKKDLEATTKQINESAEKQKQILINKFIEAGGSAGTLPDALNAQLEEITSNTTANIENSTKSVNDKIGDLQNQTVERTKLAAERELAIKAKYAQLGLELKNETLKAELALEDKANDRKKADEEKKINDIGQALSAFTSAMSSLSNTEAEKQRNERLKAIDNEKADLLKSYANQLIDRKAFYSKLGELDKQRHDAEISSGSKSSQILNAGIGGALKSIEGVAKLSSEGMSKAMKQYVESMQTDSKAVNNFSEVMGLAFVQLGGSFAKTLATEKDTGKAFLKSLLETAQAAVNMFMSIFLAKKLAMTIIDWVAIAEYTAGFILVQTALATASASFEKGGVFGNNRQGGVLEGGQNTVLVTYNEKGPEFFMNAETTNRANNISHFDAINKSHSSIEEYAVNNKTIRNLVKESLTNSEMTDITMKSHVMKALTTQVSDITSVVNSISNRKEINMINVFSNETNSDTKEKSSIYELFTSKVNEVTNKIVDVKNKIVEKFNSYFELDQTNSSKVSTSLSNIETKVFRKEILQRENSFTEVVNTILKSEKNNIIYSNEALTNYSKSLVKDEIVSEITREITRENQLRQVDKMVKESAFDSIFKVSNYSKSLASESIETEKTLNKMQKSMEQVSYKVKVTPFSEKTLRYIYMTNSMDLQKQQSANYDMSRLEKQIAELNKLLSDRSKSVAVYNTVEVELKHDTNRLLKETNRLHNYEIQRG